MRNLLVSFVHKACLQNSRRTLFLNTSQKMKRAQEAPSTSSQSENPNVQQLFDYFLVLDFEATCDYKRPLEPQEIIEFPCLKMNARSLEVESTFHRFVRPVAHPQLTPFCIELTGITQGDCCS